MGYEYSNSENFRGSLRSPSFSSVFHRIPEKFLLFWRYCCRVDFLSFSTREGKFGWIFVVLPDEQTVVCVGGGGSLKKGVTPPFHPLRKYIQKKGGRWIFFREQGAAFFPLPLGGKTPRDGSG